MADEKPLSLSPVAHTPPARADHRQRGAEHLSDPGISPHTRHEGRLLFAVPAAKLRPGRPAATLHPAGLDEHVREFEVGDQMPLCTATALAVEHAGLDRSAVPKPPGLTQKKNHRTDFSLVARLFRSVERVRSLRGYAYPCGVRP